MTFETEYDLKELKEELSELFDENGKRYTGVILSNRSEAEQLPREGWAMRGTASMPEALLRARQLLLTDTVYM